MREKLGDMRRAVELERTPGENGLQLALSLLSG